MFHLHHRIERMNNMQPSINELKTILKSSDRYADFIILDKPVPFNELYNGQDIEMVQLHSIQTYEIDKNGTKDIVGFCGQCAWKNNEIISLDHDSYSASMTVYGYSWWENKDENIEHGLDILVGDDW